MTPTLTIPASRRPFRDIPTSRRPYRLASLLRSSGLAGLAPAVLVSPARRRAASGGARDIPTRRRHFHLACLLSPGGSLGLARAPRQSRRVTGGVWRGPVVPHVPGLGGRRIASSGTYRSVNPVVRVAS